MSAAVGPLSTGKDIWRGEGDRLAAASVVALAEIPGGKETVG